MKFEKDKFIWNQVIVNIAYMNAKRKRRSTSRNLSWVATIMEMRNHIYCINSNHKYCNIYL